ncbi:SDR family NAD(P)-dependent oxidoreductase [Streptomyces panaciradicis]|uniref:SDR family NAD(P)-dependent oxidoreductase n=1 Tax=Streptomyces panaciradicis TaxID=1470261 RepID=UPI00201CC0DE|nr:SDR family NAD(P)-dependent oxidoreductase [Streptomyces panaciradicis]MCL6667475.1 SDR family NAD(P)-dependent oxidoreductase [Streptomyces panaciradicis]
MSTLTPQRVALVGGGSGGIGQAVVLRLAADGYAVAVHYAGSQSTADGLVAAVLAKGGHAIAVGGDIADETAMEAAFDAVEEAFGGIDAVVNTADIMALGPIADYDLEAFDRIIRTNVRGTFVISQQAARRVRPGGAVINFSTSVTRTQFPGYGPYTHAPSSTGAPASQNCSPTRPVCNPNTPRPPRRSTGSDPPAARNDCARDTL